MIKYCPAAGGTGAGQRRQRLAQDFLTWMDQTGDFLSLAERQEGDPIKQERLEVRGHWDYLRQCPWSMFSSNVLINTSLLFQRSERQTRNMDQAQYAEYCESRQLSFGEFILENSHFRHQMLS